MYKLKKQYRLKGYDYSRAGFYFITIVTNQRIHYFGEINNDELIYTQIGQYAKENILKFVPNKNLSNPFEHNPYFLNNSNYIISIDEWSILPNHIHLLIEINTKNNESGNTIDGLSPLKVGSISSFINHFKGKIKRFSNENSIEFNWQARFHDRIIRDQNEYFASKQYIENNLKNFKNDTL